MKYELTDELDRVACATAIRVWRRGGPIELDDLKQHARLAALEALPKHNGTSTLPGFIANAVRWRIADLYRHEDMERRHRDDHEEDLEALGDGRDIATEQAEIDEILWLITEIGETRLSPRARNTVELVLAPASQSDRPWADIERALAFAPGRIKKEARRMRAELRHELERRGIEWAA